MAEPILSDPPADVEALNESVRELTPKQSAEMAQLANILRAGECQIKGCGTGFYLLSVDRPYTPEERTAHYAWHTASETKRIADALWEMLPR